MELEEMFVRIRGRKFFSTLMVFECLFLVAQIFILFPCLVGSPPQNSIDLSDGDLTDKQKLSSHEPLDMNPDGTLRYKPHWDALESRPTPQWYEDAKIGVFIHWGIFSVPSFVGTNTKGYAEWFWYYMNKVKQDDDTEYHTQEAIDSVHEYMKNMYPPHFKYTDFAPKFTAEFFNPEKWAILFERSGARYLVLTSKHHEGFTLWGSKKSWNWNSVDVGPHRDIVGELAKAIRDRTNMRYGLYHSLYEWYHPLYLHDKMNNFTTNKYTREKLMPELQDLVQKYHPDVLWADGEWEAPCSYWNCTEFIAWLYNDSPVKDTVVTNDRWGSDVTCKHGGYLTCFDRFNPGNGFVPSGSKPLPEPNVVKVHNKEPKTTTGISSGASTAHLDDVWSRNVIMKRKWENCMTIDKESWGYRRNAKLSDYLTMDELTETLAQTVSFGGNLLINVGPTSDGRIPPILEERLLQLGTWLKINGEGIYGTRQWTYRQDPSNSNVYYTRKKNGHDTDVYAILLVWPDGDLELEAPTPTHRTQVTWLGYHGNLDWERLKTKGMRLRLPLVSVAGVPCQWAWVFRLTQLENAEAPLLDETTTKTS